MNIPRLKQSKLHEALSLLDNEFTDPKISLEQYTTDIPTTAELIHRIESEHGDIEDKMVADLGCGVGVLTIGAALLGASYVLGIDIDQDALDICQENIEIYDLETIDLLQLDISKVRCQEEDRDSETETDCAVKCCSDLQKFNKCFDTVITNPPFGTKRNKGMDMIFLQTALAMSKNSVYSFHKTSTRQYISEKAKQWNVEMKVLGEIRFLIPEVYKMHKKKSVDVEVDFVRFYHQ